MKIADAAAVALLLFLLSAALGRCVRAESGAAAELGAAAFEIARPNDAAFQFPIELLPSESDSLVAGEPGTLVATSTASAEMTNITPATHGIVYDGGWILRPLDSQRTPFELKLSFHNQFRYTGFANREAAVVNSAGATVPTPPRNDFDINRGRIIFSGYAIDPLLEYYINIDYNTVAEQPVQLLMGWIRHPFSPAFNVAYGQSKVPGTWEWLESARFTLGAERSLATTFFRPSMTTGIWADGEPLPGLHYHVLIGNGFNTLGLNVSERDTNLVYSGMVWWEPMGDFGVGFSDVDEHQSPVLRIGQAFTFNRHGSDPVGQPGPEQTVVRLSDGTPIIEPGALSPGVTVNQFDLSLYTIHAGLRHRGCSLSAEYFFRWLTSIQANGPIADDSVFDHGCFVQAGVFAVPRSIELYARGSAVFGPFGNGTEIGTGFNWYVRQQRNWRFTADVAYLNDSPAQQERTGFISGASGTLFRVQMWTYF